MSDRRVLTQAGVDTVRESESVPSRSCYARGNREEFSDASSVASESDFFVDGDPTLPFTVGADEVQLIGA